MALLGDLGKIIGVHRQVTETGEVIYWIYSNEYENEDCPKCHTGTCIQRVIFTANEDGTPDYEDCTIVHDCRDELN